MDNHKKLLLVLSALLSLLSLLLVACGGGQVEQVAVHSMGEALYDPALEPSVASDSRASGATVGVDTSNVQPQERLIIRNGNISLAAENTYTAKEAIEQMVAEMASGGAFVVSSNESGGNDQISPFISMIIRVPAERFDEAMDRIAGLAAEGTAPGRNETAQDVTAEYVDLETRLDSLENARQRLSEIMRNAQTTDDLLQAEQQLTQREAEIEALKGRMQYLSQSAKLASISIELSPYILSQPVDTRWRPAETVREAFDALVDSLKVVGDILIFFAIFCAPWLLIIVPVGYGIYRLIKWRVDVGRSKRAIRQSAN